MALVKNRSEALTFKGKSFPPARRIRGKEIDGSQPKLDHVRGEISLQLRQVKNKMSFVPSQSSLWFALKLMLNLIKKTLGPGLNRCMMTQTRFLDSIDATKTLGINCLTILAACYSPRDIILSYNNLLRNY